MDEKDLSIREVAKIAGVASSTISGWRTGNAPDNFLAVRKIAEYFNVSVGFLLTGEQDKVDATHGLPIAAVFDQGHTLFSGFAKIHIETLIPKNKEDKES